jgi:hypothetical protein
MREVPLSTPQVYTRTPRKNKSKKKKIKIKKKENPKPTKHPRTNTAPKTHKEPYTLLPLPRLKHLKSIELFEFLSSHFPFSLDAQTTFDGREEGSQDNPAKTWETKLSTKTEKEQQLHQHHPFELEEGLRRCQG